MILTCTPVTLIGWVKMRMALRFFGAAIFVADDTRTPLQFRLFSRLNCCNRVLVLVPVHQPRSNFQALILGAECDLSWSPRPLLAFSAAAFIR